MKAESIEGKFAREERKGEEIVDLGEGMLQEALRGKVGSGGRSFGINFGEAI